MWPSGLHLRGLGGIPSRTGSFRFGWSLGPDLGGLGGGAPSLLKSARAPITQLADPRASIDDRAGWGPVAGWFTGGLWVVPRHRW